MNFNIFLTVANFLNKVLFYEVFGVPLLVIWLLLPAIYFSLKLKFPNVKFFKHSFDVLKGKFHSEQNEGLLTPKQSFLMALSSNIGLGTISGTSIAIMLAGPGSLVWMAIMAFFSMNTVFVETILSIKYRKVDKKNGVVESGASRYLKFGLKEIGYKKLGLILSILYSFTSLIGMISAGTIFQTYELTNILTQLSLLANYKFMLTIVIAIAVFIIMIGGTKRCSSILNKFVPIVSSILLFMIITTLVFNFKKIPHALVIIFEDAFAIKSIVAGFIGTVVMGIRRSSMSNEAGMGTTCVSNANAKTQHPVQQATVAMLNPLIATIILCFLIGLVIVVSGIYTEPNAGNGVLLTSNAFSKTFFGFKYLLTFDICIIALSVIINSYFCSSNIWLYLFGYKTRFILYVIYIGAIISTNFINFNELITIADNFFLAVSIPNIIGLFLLRNIVKNEVDNYKKINFKS